MKSFSTAAMLVVMLFTVAVRAQSPAALIGTWEGYYTTSIPGTEKVYCRIVFRSYKNELLKGTVFQQLPNDTSVLSLTSFTGRIDCDTIVIEDNEFIRLAQPWIEQPQWILKRVKFLLSTHKNTHILSSTEVSAVGDGQQPSRNFWGIAYTLEKKSSSFQGIAGQATYYLSRWRNKAWFEDHNAYNARMAGRTADSMQALILNQLALNHLGIPSISYVKNQCTIQFNGFSPVLMTLSPAEAISLKNNTSKLLFTNGQFILDSKKETVTIQRLNILNPVNGKKYTYQAANSRPSTDTAGMSAYLAFDSLFGAADGQVRFCNACNLKDTQLVMSHRQYDYLLGNWTGKFFDNGKKLSPEGWARFEMTISSVDGGTITGRLQLTNIALPNSYSIFDITGTVTGGSVLLVSKEKERVNTVMGVELCPGTAAYKLARLGDVFVLKGYWESDAKYCSNGRIEAAKTKSLYGQVHEAATLKQLGWLERRPGETNRQQRARIAAQADGHFKKLLGAVAGTYINFHAAARHYDPETRQYHITIPGYEPLAISVTPDTARWLEKNFCRLQFTDVAAEADDAGERISIKRFVARDAANRTILRYPNTSTPPVITNRSTRILDSILVQRNELSIALYDDAQEDGDSVSVYVDDVLVLERQRLTHKAISLKIKPDDNSLGVTITMVAENVGAIPPNTAVMVIKTPRQRFEKKIISSETMSGAIRIIWTK